MMKLCLISLGALILTILAVACSDDDGGATGTGGGGGSKTNAIAAGFGALAEAYDAIIVENEATYSSATTFAPAIMQNLGLAAAASVSLPPDETEAQSSCLSEGAQGVVFEYDPGQGQYVPTSQQGAPPGGARYLLYEVDGSGNPVLPLVVSGFFDVDCTAAGDTIAVSVSNTGGVTIMDLELIILWINPPDYIVTTSPATFRDPEGTVAIGIEFSAQSEENVYEMSTRLTVVDGLEIFDPQADGFEAHAGLDDPELTNGLPTPPYTSFGLGATQSDDQENLLWNAGAVGSVTSLGTLLNIQQGLRAPLEFEDRVNASNGVLACFSGNYRAPTVGDPFSDGGCATGTIKVPLELLSESDLALLQAGSVALVDLLELLSNSLAIGMKPLLSD